ncbi:DHHA1 domain-containing protein [Archangium lansingense]|uniref:GNAT family N-acetyltransferase n=1 Tax=Archangium lansingense TaxID=2995310 RepID=A0ABT4A9R9_9BACT|nr:DHHA1 domain-containing protein [Archangium lansinium]MCY1078389.1 GNAT family N-acetyltransferase [Archangium lansinium]
MVLYDENTLEQVPWPNTPEGRFARAYLTPLMKQGSTAFLSDRTTLRLVELEGMIIPLAINDAEYGNSPMLSNFARYVTLQVNAVARGNWGPVYGRLVRGVLHGLGGVLKATSIDRCVYVDHWLVLRNMGVLLSADQAQRLTRFLVERFPQHAIVFPALSLATHSPLLNTLKGCGYESVYAFHTRLLLPYKAEVSRQVRENRRRDARLLEASGYKIVDGKEHPDSGPRLAELYRFLNEEKYSTNQRMTNAFFETALRDGTLQFRLAVKDGRIDGFFAYAVKQDVLFPPVFGYDVNLPQELGLYRGLVHQLIQEGVERGIAVELGAGADQFKSMRGDKPMPRYSAVHFQHLSGWRQRGWRLLQRFANGSMLGASRGVLRNIDGEDGMVGFDRVPETFAPPTMSPREAADLLRQELGALEQALEEASKLEGEALARALAPLAEKLHNWPQPTRRVMELRERLEKHEQRQRRGASAKAKPEKGPPVADLARQLLEGAAKLGDALLIASNLGDASSQQLRAVADSLRQSAGCAAVVLAATREGKVVLVTAATPALLQRGVDAGQLMAQVAPAVEGKGGGAQEIAWGGGSRPEGIDAALEAARHFLQARLGGTP